MIQHNIPDQQYKNESLTTSKKQLYTLHSVSQSQNEEDGECDISQFRQEIEKKYYQSVANKIYSFPIVIKKSEIEDYFSEDSETEELSIIDNYNLNSQNIKKRHIRQQSELTKKQMIKSKNYLMQKKQKNNRQKSSEIKKKYEDLLKLINKSMTKLPHQSKQQKQYAKLSNNNNTQQLMNTKQLKKKVNPKLKTDTAETLKNSQLNICKLRK